MNKFLFALLGLVLGSTVLSASDFELDSVVSFGLSQAAYSNWQSGAENQYTWTSKYAGTLKSERFTHTFKFAYGQIQSGGDAARKNIDELNWSSSYIFGSFEVFKPYFSVDLRTQFAEGRLYASDGTSTVVSSFFDPAYLTESFGFERQVWIAPVKVGVAAKQTLADETTLVSSESEVGVLISTQFTQALNASTTLASDLRVFSDFSGLDTTDIYADFVLRNQLVKQLSVELGVQAIIDKDVTDKTQVQQTLMIALTHPIQFLRKT